MKSRISQSVAVSLTFAAFATADELQLPLLSAGGVRVSDGSLVTVGQFATGDAAANGMLLHQGAVPAWIVSSGDDSLLIDGSFEFGDLPSCAEGFVPSTWFTAFITPDTYSFNCMARKGIDPDIYGNFLSLPAAHHGLRFVAGASFANQGEAFGQTLPSPLIPGRRYRLSAWFTMSDRFPQTGVFDIYLSATHSLNGATLVGSIGEDASIGVWSADSLDFVAPPGADLTRNIIMNPRPVPGGTTSYLGSDSWMFRAYDCTGDLNGDGDVGLPDLANLLAHFGVQSGATLAMGDVDGDGDVDLNDLAILLANFGAVCG